MLRRTPDTISTHANDVEPVSREIAEIDVSLVEHSLSLSYEARLEAHEAARDLMKELQNAGRQFYARQSKSTP